MPRLLRHDTAETIPAPVEAQIRFLLDAEWPGAEAPDPAQALIEAEFHPVCFVLVEADHVISYARTIWATVSHMGQSFKLYGLGDVITRKEFRLEGHGRHIVEEATAHIRADGDADAAVLLTEPGLEAFYRQSGWDHVRGLRVVTSESDGSDAGATFAMMLFLSAKARAARAAFPDETLVLPGNEW